MAKTQTPTLRTAAAVLLLAAPAPALQAGAPISSAIKTVWELFDQVVRPDPILELMGGRTNPLPEALGGDLPGALERLAGSRSPSRNDFHYAIVGLPDSPEADRLKALLHLGHSSPAPLGDGEVLEAVEAIVALAGIRGGPPPARGQWSACPECFTPPSRFDPVPPELRRIALEEDPRFPGLTPEEWGDLDRISLGSLRRALSDALEGSERGAVWWDDSGRGRMVRIDTSSPEGIEGGRRYLAWETGVPEVAELAWGELGKESRGRVMRTFLAAPPPHEKDYLRLAFGSYTPRGESVSDERLMEIAEEWDAPRSFLKAMLADYIVGRNPRAP